MTSFYLTLAHPAVGEIEAKRSRFLAVVAPAASEDEARSVVEAARKEHWDARHHCSAFILGADGSVARSSDDGEPSGTAGAPILAALRGRGLSDVCAVVTRWFGGTLLGAGGLVRAYSDAVVAALDTAEVVRRERLLRCEVDLPHALAAKVEHDLRGHAITVLGVTHSAVATMQVGLAEAQVAKVESLLAASTHTETRLRIVGETWVETHLGGSDSV